MKKTIIVSAIVGIVVMVIMTFVMGYQVARHSEISYRYGYKHGAKDYWCNLVNEQSMDPKDRHSEFKMTADGTDYFYVMTVLDVE